MVLVCPFAGNLAWISLCLQLGIHTGFSNSTQAWLESHFPEDLGWLWHELKKNKGRFRNPYILPAGRLIVFGIRFFMRVDLEKRKGSVLSVSEGQGGNVFSETDGDKLQIMRKGSFIFNFFSHDWDWSDTEMKHTGSILDWFDMEERILQPFFWIKKRDGFLIDSIGI